jgi:hypothetical protein
MYDFIQLKKDILSKSSSDIGPTYARYYDSHTCHPTHYYHIRKRLHFQILLENKFRHKKSTLIIGWSVHSTVYTILPCSVKVISREACPISCDQWTSLFCDLVFAWLFPLSSFLASIIREPLSYNFSSEIPLLKVLVQKLQNICKYSLKLGHTDTITLKKDMISMENQIYSSGNIINLNER